MKPVITLPNGIPLDLDTIHTSEIVGYQAIHLYTGRILPMCSRYEIYGAISLAKKMDLVAHQMEVLGVNDFNIFEYDMQPVFDFEIMEEADKYFIIKDVLDFD
jgi:hypothetical protein